MYSVEECGWARAHVHVCSRHLPKSVVGTEGRACSRERGVCVARKMGECVSGIGEDV